MLPAGTLFGVISISFALLVHSPISLGVIVIVLAFNPCATDSSIVSSVNVVDFSIIGVTFVTAPWLFNILSGSGIGTPFISTVSVGESPII